MLRLIYSLLEKQGFLFSNGVNGPTNYETNTKKTHFKAHFGNMGVLSHSLLYK